MVDRVRTRGAFTPGPNSIENTRYNNCTDLTWRLNATYMLPKFGVVETMNDTVTPNFRKRISKGEIIFNPMKYTKVVQSLDNLGTGPYLKHQNSSCTSPSLTSEYDVSGGIFCNYVLGFTDCSNQNLSFEQLISSSDINNLVTEVVTSCLSKRGNADNNLFESVAEWRQTFDMFRHPTQVMNRFLDAFDKRIRKIRRLQGASQAWLTYRYGVRPFIKDVSGIIDGLAFKSIGKKRVRYFANKTISRRLTQTYDVKPIWSVVTTSVNRQMVDQFSARAVSFDEYVADLASNVGFTAKGLITVPWELVPYSFVVDWFVNVGDFLNAITPSPSYKQLGSCLVTERTTSNSWTAISSSSASPFNLLRPVTGSFSTSILTKTRSSSLPQPGLVIKNDFRLDTITRAADAISLIAQRLDSLFG